MQAKANSKKKKCICAHNDMNHSPERLYENLIAGLERRSQRERNREIKELRRSTLFLLARLFHQPGSAKEIQFIIIDHTRLQVHTGTLKKLQAHTQRNTHQASYQMSEASVTGEIDVFQILLGFHISLVSRF